jgi:hypothetical protein
MKTVIFSNRLRDSLLTVSFNQINRFQEERGVVMKIKKIEKKSTGLCKCKRSC